MRLRLATATLMVVIMVSCGGGGGGSNTPDPNPNPNPTPEPYPPAGEVYDKTCVGYDLTVTYHDGEGGFYEQTDVNANECGYIVPSLDVSIDNTYGDRFKPVVVTVDYKVQGETSGAWTHDVGERINDTTLHVYGSGVAGDGFVLINDQEYTFQFREEPRCAKPDPFNDCLGYAYSGDVDGLIYYGEEDTDVVEWEISIVFYGAGEGDNGDARLIEPGDSLYEMAEEKVAYMNKAYARSKVYIKYKLVAVGVGLYTNSKGIWEPNYGPNWGVLNATDIQLGSGRSCPDTCGCATVNRSFREDSMYPLGSASLCGGAVDVHEIGHSVGLAHGPDNRGYPANGYIFPDFGHGHSTPFCGRWTDFMSYAEGRIVVNNSRQTCAEYADDEELYRNVREEEYDNPTGNRSYADSAYHLNRIRYDVSLVHCAREGLCIDRPRLMYNTPAEEVEVVRDPIDSFESGREMLELETRKLRRAMLP